MSHATAERPPAVERPKSAAKGRQWAPRIWEGCDFFAWLRLLTVNRFAVDWPYVYIAVIISVVSSLQTVLRLIQATLYGRRVARTKVRHAPLFIVGHWRTGTTLLHEFLIRDERHTFPTTYECFSPNHFLISEQFFLRWLRFLLPSRRPMDNMAAGYERPQEDEFALAMLGLPSPYRTIGFPNNPPQCQEYYDFAGVPPRDLARWKHGFLRFLQHLTFKDPRRLVLKSPPHSCRIPVLLEMFPDARFVHIVRDPYVVFPSAVNLWKSLYRTHGLQTPTFAGLEELVFATFTRLYGRLEEGKKHVPSGRFHELRYEDLVKDPVGEMLRLYEALELGEFDRFRPRLEAYLATVKDYETNRYEMTPEQRAEVTRRWGDVIWRYGYGG
jgi:omega-hydroxy-beta-dihydromenaquinone-9 sulfotransferase